MAMSCPVRRRARWKKLPVKLRDGQVFVLMSSLKEEQVRGVWPAV